MRALYNFTGEYITSLSAITTPALNQYRYSMKTLNVGASYQYRPNLGFSVDIANLFNEPQEFYMGNKNRFRQGITNFVTVNVAMNGRF